MRNVCEGHFGFYKINMKSKLFGVLEEDWDTILAAQLQYDPFRYEKLEIYGWTVSCYYYVVCTL